MDFLKTVKSDLEKAGVGVGTSGPPRYWFSSGNYVLNKILSGSFYGATPQGRLIALCGPSGCGKSFLAANMLREAQQGGALAIMIDSEHAFDDNFASNIGINVEENYGYYEVDTIEQATKTLSQVIAAYKKEYGMDNPDAPKVVIVLDSLDMLTTSAELEHFQKGEVAGDMGQRNKQHKTFLRNLVQAIKRVNISIIITSQGYKNQDKTNGEGWWVIAEAIKFSLSQILLLGKLKLKDKEKNVQGITMKCEGYKTRFTKPFQTVRIEVPYDAGMDPYNGLLDVAVDMDIVGKSGAWYNYKDNKFYSKNFGPHAEEVLKECEAKREKFLDADIDDSEIETDGDSSRAKRKKKFDEKQEATSE